MLCRGRACVISTKLTCVCVYSVDIDTDRIMQEVIRTEFRHATVIAVAHRLDTILDFDQVIVIDKGVIIEQDNPQRLLARPSAFKALFEMYHSRDEEEEQK